ncbi:MAG: lysylphosphatidylglycerol synthase transmembrane domain-containing protein [Patescibacteria group bacterium]
MMLQGKNVLLWLKLFGILLFVWILWHIDRVQLLQAVRGTDLPLAALSFLVLLVSYLARTWRWHALVRAGGMVTQPRESWRVFNLGVFLGAITPGNVGELGRGAYLYRGGMHGGASAAIPVLDRLADFILLLFVSLWGIGELYGNTALAPFLIALLLFMVVFTVLWKLSAPLRQVLPRPALLAQLLTKRTMAAITAATLLSWILYIAWTLLLARALGIAAPAAALVAALVLARIASMLPVAPAGLGTRDAVLVVLLAPYGVAAPQAVALGFLLFLFILASSSIGFFYWIRDRRAIHSPR